MKIRSASVLVFLLSLTATTVATVVQDRGRVDTPCSVTAVNLAKQPVELRSLIDQCKAVPEIAVLALSKLNMLPLPAIPRIAKFSLPSDQVRELMNMELSIFFGLGEAYPTDEGFAAMSEMVRSINTSRGVIKRVAILGGVDAVEAGSALARSVATDRAKVLERYLRGAGVERSLISTTIRLTAAGSSDTPVQDDRVAYLVIVFERPIPVAAPSK